MGTGFTYEVSYEWALGFVFNTVRDNILRNTILTTKWPTYTRTHYLRYLPRLPYTKGVNNGDYQKQDVDVYRARVLTLWIIEVRNSENK